jgi:hypothetical protein
VKRYTPIAQEQAIRQKQLHGLIQGNLAANDDDDFNDLFFCHFGVGVFFFGKSAPRAIDSTAEKSLRNSVSLAMAPS